MKKIFILLSCLYCFVSASYAFEPDDYAEDLVGLKGTWLKPIEFLKCDSLSWGAYKHFTYFLEGSEEKSLSWTERAYTTFCVVMSESNEPSRSPLLSSIPFTVTTATKQFGITGREKIPGTYLTTDAGFDIYCQAGLGVRNTTFANPFKYSGLKLRNIMYHLGQSNLIQFDL